MHHDDAASVTAYFVAALFGEGLEDFESQPAQPLSALGRNTPCEPRGRSVLPAAPPIPSAVGASIQELRKRRFKRRSQWSVAQTGRLGRSQDDDRVVDLFKGVERLCGNTEDGGQHPRWKPAEGLTYSDVVLVLWCAGVLDDHYLHVIPAPVLEVVEGTLGCEHDASLCVRDETWPFAYLQVYATP